MAASALHDLPGRATPDQATPEAPCRNIPREFCQLPPARVAFEEHPRSSRAHAATTILAQHQEFADLARAGASEVCAIADEREAGRPAVHQEDEVLLPTTRPESSMPSGTTERTVCRHVPAITPEVVDVELDKVAHRRTLHPSDGTKVHSHGGYISISRATSTLKGGRAVSCSGVACLSQRASVTLNGCVRVATGAPEGPSRRWFVFIANASPNPLP